MEQGGWAAKEDRVVRIELAKLQDGLRSWARKYSREAVNSDLEKVSTPEEDKIVEELKGYCVQTNWCSLLEQMPISSNKVFSVFIQALLAKDVFDNIFPDPFFAFPETVDDSKLPNRAEMRLLYQTMAQLNKKEAQIWRSHMMRVLSAYPSGDKGSLMSDRLQRMASSHAKALINGPAHIFLRDPENQAEVIRRSDDLHRLYHQAGGLALSLWTQRTVIESYGLQRLHEFSSSSSLMTAHRLYHLDEDDKRLDGKKILLCVQPTVLAFGNENAEDYDNSKVWAKAIVLLEGDM
ncbi:hypothetical protein SI65_02145 [Aspergillus cristatus]|uniref:Uncharacterized protein n=1 Tax=Aspergillus cristatus TaxID=573508 RepID=A0A1E3BUF5_ASPCR|nr:hypothetical protein SI65_01739 [Aspergillus cristatus]ODM24555.1 hypothetical protein SI65_02145 [Aspergillus cristatus]